MTVCLYAGKIDIRNIRKNVQMCLIKKSFGSAKVKYKADENPLLFENEQPIFTVNINLQ